MNRVTDATKVIRDSQVVFVRFLIRWRHFANYNSRPHTIYYFDLQCKQIVCRVAFNLIIYFESRTNFLELITLSGIGRLQNQA